MLLQARAARVQHFCSEADRNATAAQEDERGSSAEEGSDEENDEEEGSDEEGSGDESPSERRRPRKKHKPFVAPPPRALPQRTTRGARVAAEAGEEGDEEFWVSRRHVQQAVDRAAALSPPSLCYPPTASTHLIYQHCT